MRRFIAVSCCVIVGLQFLIGVPAITCLALLLVFQGNGMPPASVEFRAVSDSRRPLPVAAVDEAEPTAQSDSILEARHQRGSLLAGTVLGDGLSPAEEQRAFVAAFRQVATDSVELTAAPANLLPERTCNATAIDASQDLRAGADRFAIDHLYLIAEQDEQAGLFERSDQWRAQARAIRRSLAPGDDGDLPASSPCSGDVQKP